MPLAARLAAILLLLSPLAEARVQWSTPGSYRVRTTWLDDVPLDEHGTVTGRRIWGDHRLRIDPTIQAGAVRVYMEVDVLTGQVFGDTSSMGARFVERRHGDPERSEDGWTTVEPRMIWADWRGEWGVVQAGQMGARWGMGLLDDDGMDRPEAQGRWVERMGDRRNGDLVDRLFVAVRPLAPLSARAARELLLGGGVDYIWQDDQARLLDGDQAWRAFGMLQYPGEEFTGGLYVVHRQQEDSDGDTLVITALDVHGRWELPLYRLGADVRLEGEAVLVTGHTDRQRPVGSAADSEIRQLGWVVRGEIAWRCPRIAMGLEGGYASGDADPADGELRTFRFDPDHQVGLILFPDVVRLARLRGAERVADPTRVGVPPGGADALPTGGAVENAQYLHPGVTWRPGPWRLSATALVAWAAEPFLDPYRTLEAGGGSGRNHLDGPAARFYGVEAAGAAHYTLPRFGPLDAMEIGARGGVLLPGAALEGVVGGEPVYKVVARVDVRWR